jgi:hypothetical protein
VAINGGETGLEGIPLKAVVADILPDNGAVFLFDETIVIFLMVPGAGKRDGADGVAVPASDDMVDKLAAVVAMELLKEEGEVHVYVPEGIESPAMGLVKERIQANPAGGDMVTVRIYRPEVACPQ